MLNHTAGSQVISRPLWGVGGPAAAWGASPAPDWAYATPSSLPDGNHFLDFSSIYVKDKHNIVSRVSVPAGSCIPGNLLNVRTSAASYPGLTTPATPVINDKRNFYTTTGARARQLAAGACVQPARRRCAPCPDARAARPAAADSPTNGDLSVYQPRSDKSVISIYFGAHTREQQRCGARRARRDTAPAAACSSTRSALSSLLPAHHR